MASGEEIRVITLEDGEHLTSVVRKIEKGWIVRFVRGSSLLGCDVQIRTTLTADSPLEWRGGPDHLSAHCDVPCTTAGSFRYTFTVDGSPWEKPAGSGYFLVMPTLRVNGEPLPLDGISCQTHLTKLLGSFEDWEPRLKVAAESGYNMVHLTPIHQLGISESGYSIADHHALMQTVESSNTTFEDIDQLVKKMESDWGVLTVQDVVWNHAAKNAKWLQEHPECAYNCLNSPHLRPAYVVDRLYHYFSKEVADGKWEHRGVPKVVDNVHHVNAIKYVLRTEVLPKSNLHEFFQVDVESLVQKFSEKVIAGPSLEQLHVDVPVVQDPQWRRFGSTVDLSLASKVFNVNRGDVSSEEERRHKCIDAFRSHLEHLNLEGGKRSWEILMAGLDAMIGHITYERVAGHGPRKGAVTEKEPLTCDYFQHLEGENGVEEDEKLAFDEEKSAHLMAFNGWVMSDNPLKNFALSDSQVYLRRELVCWGDSVKLNYGEKPEDCPYLWNYMKEYTQKCAKIFHGLRIDNAHGTPIHVAEYLLLAARQIRPDLYVFAELFTGSEQLDNMFVNRLGISSLIREAQSAHDSHEQGRLVYRYGGDCVGAMIQQSNRLAPASIAHALFLDQSHDNPTPIETRSVFDLLPTAAMISMASCAAGSTRGYDELVRHAIHVVSEKRPYGRWEKEVSADSGIVIARKILNRLHANLAKDNYTQVFVDQMSPDVVAVTRHNPVTHSTVVVVSHTAFNKGAIEKGRVHLKHFPVGGVLDEVLFEMKVVEVSPERNPESDVYLNGLENYRVAVREHVVPEESEMCVLHGGRTGHIELTNLPSGAVVGFRIHMADDHQKSIDFVRELISGENCALDAELEANLKSLSQLNLNRLLFCCEEEEHVNIGQGAYNVPNYGKFVYCGLQGLIPVLEKIRDDNDLGHPLCQNLRDGTWLAEFICARLKKYDGLEKTAELFEKATASLRGIPYYLRPCYFEAVISYLYKKTRKALFDSLAPTVNMASPFVQSLVLSSTSFVGFVRGAELAPLPPSLSESPALSIAAGLPHFSTGIWRNWGRDTFIALPGCLLSTGRFDDARKVILSFAGCLRHGLIPNLLAEGKGARYNCRDAVWFWLYSVVRYVEAAPNGEEILKAPVRRIYVNDEAGFCEEEREQPLVDVMLEAVQRHFNGIAFRERNAGQSIDEHMRDEGFNVSAYVDKDTGFVGGGNRWNCGTWMDKMGSSEKAGNRGEPATPRDGAAVELQGLASAVLDAFDEWNKKGWMSKSGVQHDGISWTWSEWCSLIRANFKTHFYVGAEDKSEFVNRRGIVKDSVGSSLGFTDYQLRCNLVIALAADPDLLDAKVAWDVLTTVKEVLMGPLGIKTLDPSDWAYDGFYNNSDQGSDKKTAHGWNYHQGPEWLWVAGVYLKARLVVGRKLGGEHRCSALKEARQQLGNYWAHIQNSLWRSLPELTQEAGAECPGSCAAQAWSIGCLLEVCEEIAAHQEK